MPNELPPRDEYLPRIVDDQVRRYLEIFGAVEVAGTKWCGKTWTACRHGESVSYVDDALALAQSDPQAMLAGEQPHVIDEWQLAPAIWNTVRHAVDRKRGLRGAWLLTGSSTPSRERRGSGESDAQRRRPHRPHSHAPDEPCRIGRLDRSGFPGRAFPRRICAGHGAGGRGLPCRCGVPRWLARDVGSFPEPISSHRKGVPEPIVLGKRPAPRPRRRFGTAHRAFPRAKPGAGSNLQDASRGRIGRR